MGRTLHFSAFGTLRLGLFLGVFGWVLNGLGKTTLPHGYVSDPSKERQESYKEVFLFVRPNTTERPLVEAIFNPQLSKEFKDRYRERFGQLDTESITYQRAAQSPVDPTSNELNRDSEQSLAQQRERRSYAEYMVKRLTEWHTDNYFRSQPNMRPVYELKERLSKMDVQVTKETKMEVRYELSSNNLDFILDNPYLDSKFSVEMDPGSFGPSSVQENRLWLGKNISPKTRINNNWATLDGLVTLEFLFFHHARLSTSIGTTAKYTDNGRAEGATRYLAGLNYLF